MACLYMGSESSLEINNVGYQFLKATSQTVRILTSNANQVITGSLDPDERNAQPGLEFVGVRIYMQPSHAELLTLVPLFLDGSGPYTSGSAFTQVPISIDKGDTTHTFSNCGVNTAVLSGQKGGTPITLMLDFLGIAETQDDAQVIASATPGLGYGFEEGTMSLNSGARSYDRFQLTIDRNLYRDFNNSVTATCLKPSGNKMTFSTSVPYVSGSPDNTGLYWSEKAATGNAGSLAFTRGSNSMTISLASLMSITRPPSILGRDKETRLSMNYEVMKDASNAAVTVTFV